MVNWAIEIIEIAIWEPTGEKTKDLHILYGITEKDLDRLTNLINEENDEEAHQFMKDIISGKHLEDWTHVKGYDSNLSEPEKELSPGTLLIRVIDEYRRGKIVGLFDSKNPSKILDKNGVNAL
jgi:hypothetical protein